MAYTTYTDRMRSNAKALVALADKLEEIANKPAFSDDDSFMQLITPYEYDHAEFSVILTVKESHYNDNTEKWDYTIKEDETNENIRKFIKACGGRIEKEWVGSNLKLTKKFRGFTFIGTVDRTAVCKPLVTKKVWHEPYTSKGYYTEEVEEWDCHSAILDSVAPELEEAI